MKIIGVSGSLRWASYNAGLLRAARAAAPEGVEIVIGSIHDIPLYDGDLEAAEGLPEAVVTLKDAIAGADALLLVTPEYNNGVPGVFKNAIDWLSRPASDIPRVFAKPVGLIGASPGGFGTILSQAAWLPILRTLGADLWNGRKLLVSGAGRAFDADGELVDEAVREQLAKYLAGFAAYVAEK